MNSANKKDYASAESRRSTSSRRRMGFSRRVYYALGLPVLRAAIAMLRSTYRVETRGAENVAAIIDEKRFCAPCYWHQQHILCSTLIRSWIRRGFKACFLVSGSVDGEVPERIAKAWGAEVIRGSANQSGALALRDMQSMFKKGYSIVTTADGPRGPKYEFKLGAILMARIAKVPIIPIGCAADRAWYLKRWDNFMIPKPFARVIITIGAPYQVPSDAPLDDLEPHRLNVQQAVMSTMADSEKCL